MGEARNGGGVTADWDVPTPEISHRETGGMGEAGNGSPFQPRMRVRYLNREAVSV